MLHRGTSLSSRASYACGLVSLAATLAFACGPSASTETTSTSGTAPAGSSAPESTTGSSSDASATERDAAIAATAPRDAQSPSDAAADASDADASADDGPPALDYVGRFDARDPSAPACAWSGCGVRLRFEGTALSVTLNDAVASWMVGGPSVWSLTIDGTPASPLVLSPGARNVALAEALPAGTHEIVLTKRSEAQDGVTSVGPFDYHGGRLLAPPEARARRIEIIGDSTPAGMGDLATIPAECTGAVWSSAFEDFGVAFGGLLGNSYGAEVRGITYSGKGLTKNLYRPDTDTIPVIYPRANPLDPATTIDLSAWVPDVVVLMLGANDFDIGQPVDDGPATLSDFTAAYINFVNGLRSPYPTTLLLLTISPSVSDAAPAGRNTRTNLHAAIASVVAARAALGDARVVAVEPAAAAASEVTGCAGHGNTKFHARVASALSAVIGAQLGW